MIKERKNEQVNLKFKTVRNIFLVYLFTSAVTGKYDIFAAICASFPFILPVLFYDSNTHFSERIARSVLYGTPGILVSVLFMLVTKSYSTYAWLVPSLYSFAMCIGFCLVQRKLSEHKRTVMKCIISVSVCFLAFV